MRPKLTIGMMVKNEERWLEKCLSSLLPILNSISSELVIIDTGSEDRTVDIARQFTDRVYFHEWSNNFSEMRNRVIGYAQGEWFLTIDGDEIIDNPVAIIEFLRSEASTQYNTGLVTIKNFASENDETTFATLVAPRLFRNDGQFRYEGAVHNQPQYRGPVIHLDTTLLHYGYIHTDSDLMERKFKRTTTILKEELKKNPSNIYYWFQLSVSYAMHGDHNQAIDPITRAYELLPSETDIRRRYMYVFHQRARAHLRLKEYAAVIDTCDEAIKLRDDYPDLHYYKAKAHFALSEWDAATASYLRYMNIVTSFTRYESSNDMSVTHYSLGAIDEVRRDLGILYYKKGDSERFLQYIKSVEDVSTLGDVIEAVVHEYCNRKHFSDLVAFYERLRTSQHEGLAEALLSALERLRLTMTEEDDRALSTLFSKGPSPYAVLNRVRLVERGGQLCDDTLAQVSDLDWEGLPLYYGDLLYLLLRDGNISPTILLRISKDRIVDYLQVAERRHDDVPIVVGDMIEQLTDVTTLPELRVATSLTRYIISNADLDTNSYLEFFSRYVHWGTRYVSSLYQQNALDHELLIDINDNQHSALLMLSKAEDHGDPKRKVEYLRRAVRLDSALAIGVRIKLHDLEAAISQQQNLESLRSKLKANIRRLIEQGFLEEARDSLTQYARLGFNDPDTYSMGSVIEAAMNNTDEAIRVARKGLEVHPDAFDLWYNVAYLEIARGDYEPGSQALSQARRLATNDEQLLALSELERQCPTGLHVVRVSRPRIAFFLKRGMNSFFDDIMDSLSAKYETRKIIVDNEQQIVEGLVWADVGWFDWCDELLVYASHLDLARKKKIIGRLHRYEAFTRHPSKVNWENVDHLIVVTPHLLELLRSSVPDLADRVRVSVISNGVNLSRYTLAQDHGRGYNIAYIGYVHMRKNPPLVLQIMHQLTRLDDRYKLYMAGMFQDPLAQLYFNYMRRELGLEENVVFCGWQDDIGSWLVGKSFVLSASIHESFGYGIAEGMAMGLKPVIHNFPYAKEIWPADYLFNTVDEAVTSILGGKFEPNEYRNFIKQNYSLEKQMAAIDELLGATPNTPVVS